MTRKTFDYKDIEVVYDIEGNGEALVFLHGYLESRKTWDGFSNGFKKQHTVLRMDIPGHGESGVFADLHHMDELACVLKGILEKEHIEKACIIGHSMGGYMTMAFVAQFPEMTKGYVLFHSTCFADNEEKRTNRDREISLIQEGRKQLIINTNIPNAFADDNLGKYKLAIDKAKEIALETDEKGIVSILEGMKVRKDYSAVLSNSLVRPLLIWGAKDNYINWELVERLLKLAPDAMQVALKHSGHMGFLEEADCARSGILTYLSSLE